jgi:hypothetical protein
VIPQKVAVGNPVGNGPVLLACKNPVIYGLPAQRWPLIHLPVQLPSACWCNWQPASTTPIRADRRHWPSAGAANADNVGISERRDA